MEALDSYHMMLSLAESFSTPFVIKAIIKLGIPNILAKSDKPIHVDEMCTILQAATGQAHNSEIVRRLMQSLCRKNIFEEQPAGVFGHNSLSRWLIDGTPKSLASFFLLTTSEAGQAAWHHLHELALEVTSSSTSAFAKAHGKSIFEFAANDPVFADLWFGFLDSFGHIIINGVLEGYDGFQSVAQVLVDVGGGTGLSVSKIVQAFPHIKGVNFDLPHTIASGTQNFPGVEHIAGDMFESVPKGDAIYMQNLQKVLHNWNDEKAKAVLKNCYNALPVGGKIIIVDHIFDPHQKAVVDQDLGMLVFTGGKQRSASEWRELLASQGFSNVNFKPLPAVKSQAVIEAFK
ncbi:desmethylxanthohumol 6'-O-methyltransferase isoform X1 [Selaginella moellendorffii]|uniref:desmethylxanthohumol 6'-O-methyltransferase isoform X1 n=1 Tax=Selaginella moellendorffii TaxID=88036 RepID=UPI000D1C7D1C|nr:desmethylxanthohumol 6'-O-methyltransferase isoform X1 [Selaginella moellendorffii]|eukprot:XP_024540559.1 desmethylxanthohumol 6'-O-methyltransferase isoform X1 [Selaginella moellendorffii]